MRQSNLAVSLLFLCAGIGAGQTPITLLTPSPTSGLPGVTSISITATGFPAGAVTTAATQIQLAPAVAGSGASAILNPSTVTAVSGGQRFTFVLPAAVAVSSATPYTINISGTTGTAAAFASLSGASITLTPPAVSAVILSPASVIGSLSTATNKVTLTGPAPAAGAVVTLSSGDTTIANPDAAVTVPGGTTVSPVFNIATHFVSAPSTVAISAAYGGVTKSATLSVQPVQVSAVVLTSATIIGSLSTTTNKVTLNAPAPPAGATVQLSSDNAACSVSGTVSVAAGSTTSATFTITTAAVSTQTVAHVTATYGGISKLATVTVNPIAVSALALATTTVGGTPLTATVTLNAPAATPTTVQLTTSDSTLLSIPATLSIAAGASKSDPIPIATQAVATASPVTVSASYGGVTKQVQVTINPPSVSAVVLTSATLVGSLFTTTNKVILNGPAPSAGVVVQLASDNPAAAVPANVTVAAGTATSAAFTLTTASVPSQTVVHITATYGASTRQATLTLNPIAVSALSLASTTVGGTPLSATVTLNAPAVTDAVVQLTTSDSTLLSLPATVTIPTGAAKSGPIAIATQPVTAASPVTVSASFGGTTRQVQVTINPPSLTALVLSPSTVLGTVATSFNHVILNGPAPAGGVSVALLSDDTTKATVPATIMVQPGATSSDLFTINTQLVPAQAIVPIHATLAAVTKSANLTVNPIVVQTVTLSPATVISGLSTTLNKLTLNGPAPSTGALVTLSTDMPSLVTLPANVTVAASQTASPAFTIGTQWSATQVTATIMATYNGVTHNATLTINPTSASVLKLSPTSVIGSVNTALNTVTLDSPAPVGGASVALSSSNPAVATVGTPVVVAQGQTVSPAFTIQTFPVAASTQVTITAAYGAQQRTAILTVNPILVTALTLSPATVLGGLPTSNNTVTINSPAPVGGQVVALESGNSLVASVPASITVPQGSTVSPPFSIATNSVASSTIVPVTATLNGVSKSGNLTVSTGPTLDPPTPNHSDAGTTLTITLSGNLTGWTNGVTKMSLGAGISVGGAAAGSLGPISVTGPGTATASIAISPSAATGVRTLTVKTNTEQETLTGAFTVTGGTLISVSVAPNTSPAAGLPGATMTVAGSGFPTATIPPNGISLSLVAATAGAGPSATVTSIAVTANNAGSRQVSFIIPDALTFAAATPYLVSLQGVASDGSVFASTNMSAMTVGASAASAPPLANAGPNQTVNVTTVVNLNGSASTDPAGNPLTYNWSFLSRPATSSATLSNPNSSTPSFTADRVGNYYLQLVVADSSQTSQPATVVVSTLAVPPIANAGPNQSVNPATLVTLNGSGSYDPGGATLKYTWSFVSKPTGTAAVLANATTVNPTFTVDRAGNYVVQLVVNNGSFNSPASQVTISTANVAPVANPGPNQTVAVGALVHLTGSGSTDANGDPLTYKWSLISKPAGSAAALSSTTIVNPTFTVDVTGSYIAQLIVNDGLVDSAAATVTVSTNNIPPTANAGPNQTVQAGSTVHLNGSGSSDANGNPLTYQWSFSSVPAGSAAQLTGATTVTPTFVADAVGTFVVQLVVNNGNLNSTPSSVTITTTNTAPVANPGLNQLVNVGATVQLDAGGSTDTDGDALTYAWSLTTKPSGSAATLSSTTAVKPTFVADLGGTYVAQLIVNDGFVSSTPMTVTISTNNVAPVANPGSNQLVSVGSVVMLDGTGSTDQNGYALTYAWSLTTVPSGSSASISTPTSPKPAFTVDKAGTYVAQLVVSDPLLSSAPATVTISTNNIPPVANPGSNQSVFVGTLVTLDGTGSTGTSGYPLTYSWSMLTKPAGSTAAIAGPTNAKPTFTPDLPGTYVAQLIVNDNIQNSTPATVSVTAVYSNVVTVSLTSNNLLTYSSTAGTVSINIDAPAGGQTVNISTDNSAVGVLSTAANNPAEFVVIPAGQRSATFTVTTGGTAGSATITGFATQFQNGTAGFSVSNRSLTMQLSSPTVAQGRTITGTLTMTQSPVADLTVNLASNATSVATITPASLVIPAGQTSASFTVTGVSINTATFTATPQTPGYTTSSANITVLSPSLSINIPHNVTVGPGQTVAFPISLASAPASDAAISLVGVGTGTAPGSVTFTPAQVTIPAGSTTPLTQPTITGGTIGTVQVTASSPGYAPDQENESVSLTMTFSPTSQTVLTFNTATLSLSLSSPAPTGGLTINLAIDDMSKATVPSTVNFAAGTASATVTITGVAAGSTTLHASYPGLTTANAPITVNNAPAMSLLYQGGYNSPSTGKDEQFPYGLTLSQAAPAGNLNVMLTSSDPSKMLLSTSSTVAGSASITVQVAAGSSVAPTYYVQSLTDTGSATITAKATGYANATQTVSFLPIGFYISGGGTTTYYSADTSFSVSYTTVNATTHAFQSAFNPGSSLRPGVSPVTINFTNSTPATGTISATSVTFNGGDGSRSASFHPLAVGSTTISIDTPAGYLTPTTQQSISFTVRAPSFSLSYQGGYANPSVGKDQQFPYAGSLEVSPPIGGVDVTITSSDTSKVLLSTSNTTLGTGSITLHVNAGISVIPTYYVQAISDTGSATLTATAANYTFGGAETVSLLPIGFYISGGGSTTTFSSPTAFSFNFTTLNPNTFAFQSAFNPGASLRPGFTPVTLTVTNGTDATGTISGTSVTFNFGDSSKSLQFTPKASGADTITLAAPAGYPTPSTNQSITFTVTAPNSSLNYQGGWANPSIGKDLEFPYSASLGVAAPAGGVTMTITSSDTTRVLLSTASNTLGGSSLTFNIAAGQSTAPTYYVQCIADNGSSTLNLNVTGYNSATTTVTCLPTGFYVNGGGTTTTFSGPSGFSVNVATLTTAHATGGGFAPGAVLRPGISPITVNLTNSNTAVGTISANSVTFNAGDTSKGVNFQPSTTTGSTTISIDTPAGYTLPTNNQSNTYTVTAPSMSLNYQGGWANPSIGKDLQFPYGLSLGTAAPSGGETVTITSGDPTKVLLSSSATAVGSSSLTFTIAQGQASVPTYYVQVLDSSGVVTLSATAPGYNSTSTTVTCLPTGFYISGGGSTTTFSGDTAFSVGVSTLNPSTLNTGGGFAPSASLRPGVSPITVNFSNSTPATGAINNTSVVLNAGDSVKSAATFHPLASGSTTISLSATPPAGYSLPSNAQSISFTVTAPNSSLNYQGGWANPSLGKDLQTPYGFTLGVASPAGGTPVTITSSDPTRVLLSTSASAVGSSSISFTIAQGQSAAPTYYLQILADNGSSTISSTATGYNPSTTTVSCLPTGFYLSGGGTTSTLNGATSFSVNVSTLSASTLNTGGGFAPSATLRAGVTPITVTINNGTPAVGSIGASSVTFNALDTGKSVSFTPLANGSDTITINTPAGYVTPQNNQSIAYTVTAPGMGFNNNSGGQIIGKNMQFGGYYISLGAASPVGGTPVTITVNSAQALLSTSSTTVGTGSLTLNIASGQSSTSTFFIQALQDTGTLSVQFSAPLYAGNTGSVTLYPSGFVLSTSNFSTTTSSSPTTLTVQPAALNPQFLTTYQVQQLRPGMSNTQATVTMTDNPGAAGPVGSITVNPLIFNGADNPNSLTTSFQPLNVGSTVIKVQSPAGFSQSSSQVVATVN